MVGICYAKNKECVFTGGKIPTDGDVKRACKKVTKARVYSDPGLGRAPIELPFAISARQDSTDTLGCRRERYMASW